MPWLENPQKRLINIDLWDRWWLHPRQQKSQKFWLAGSFGELVPAYSDFTFSHCIIRYPWRTCHTVVRGCNGTFYGKPLPFGANSHAVFGCVLYGWAGNICEFAKGKDRGNPISRIDLFSDKMTERGERIWSSSGRFSVVILEARKELKNRIMKKNCCMSPFMMRNGSAAAMRCRKY